MNDQKFNGLLWDFHQSLKRLRNFTDDTVKTYISCIIKYREYADNTLNINLLASSEEQLFEYILSLSKTVSSSRISVVARCQAAGQRSAMLEPARGASHQVVEVHAVW